MIEIVEWAGGIGAEFEITVFGIASQEALAFECAPDTFGHALDERLQLLLTWGINSPEYGRLGANEVSAVEHEGVKMDIEIERRPEALDQRHRTRRATPTRESRLR